MSQADDGPIVSLERREGSLLWADDHYTQGRQCPVISYLTIATIITEGGDMSTVNKFHGPLSTVAEGMALFLLNNPGMIEAVMGLMNLHTQRKLQGRS